METKTIVRVNNVDIIATSDEQMIFARRWGLTIPGS